VIKMGKESNIQIWQYITAILLIFFLGFHLAERIPQITGLSYHQSLESEHVYSTYASFGWVLWFLAAIALFHGLNGLRVIFLEWRQGKTYSLTVNALFWIVYLVLLGLATWTVIGLPSLG
jgi:succinate dehydrogenase / fumarate reductase membrane anchor subunit